MDRRKELIIPGGQESLIRNHSTRPTKTRPYGLHCRECNAVFYVDENTYQNVSSAMSFDPSNNPFICERCEEAYGDEAFGH